MDLFAGIDLDDEPIKAIPSEPFDDYEDLDSKKKKEEIRKLQIQNEKELRNLVERDLVISVMGEIGQSLKNNFIDQSKRKANIWANKLGITEKERDIEKLIGELVKEGIEGVIMDIERLSSEGIWE